MCQVSSSSIRSSLVASSSIESSSDGSCQISQDIVHKYSLPQCDTIMKVKLVDNLLHDVSKPLSRMHQLKKKKRSMEIKYYRHKCIRSLKKCAKHYDKVSSYSDIIDSCIHSSISSELSRDPRQIESVRAMPIVKIVSKSAMEVLQFKLVLAMVYAIILLYEYPLVNAMAYLIDGRVMMKNSR